jgi:serine/threonine protein kinase
MNGAGDDSLVLFPSHSSSISEDSQQSSSPIPIALASRGFLRSRGFELVQLLQDSLQGQVWLAKYSGKKVVVKVIRKSFCSERKAFDGRQVAENALREIEVMETLESLPHPNVIRMVQSLEDTDNIFIVLEHASRGDLLTFLLNRRLSEEDARVIFLQILSGVTHLHDCQICHLDLSLENCLITQEGILKICDFGLARLNPFYESFVSKPSYRPGKLHYMSPEIVELQEFNGFSSDLYSLGVILFCLLFQFFPYDAPRHTDPAFLAVVQGDICDVLRIHNCLGRVSQSAESLLRGLLCLEDVRMTLEEVQDHPWLRGDPTTGQYSDEDMDLSD